MARYTYRVAVMSAHINYALSEFTPDPNEPTRSYTVQGVMINGGGIRFCAGTCPITSAPIDQWQALSKNEDYAIAAAGSFCPPLTGSPAVPYGGPLDAGKLAQEISQYITMQRAARAHGHDYDNSRTILQIVRGELEVADGTVFALANRVEGSRFSVYRGTRDRLECVWEGSEEEFWTRYRAASEKVRADEAYIARYQKKWAELRRENIATLLPELARKDGVLLMSADEFSKWQTKAKSLVCPTPEQVRRALNAPAPIEDTTEQIETAQIEDTTAQIETGQIETEQIETAQIEATPVETAQIEGAQIETAQTEAAQTEATPIEAAQTKDTQSEDTQSEATPIEDTQSEATPIEDTPEQREKKRQERLRALYARMCALDERTSKIEHEKSEPEQIETEQVEAEKKPRRSRRRANAVTVAQCEQVEQA